MWFGVGAIVAALLALTGIVGLPLQIVIFFAVSIALTIASRTIFERFFIASSPGEKEAAVLRADGQAQARLRSAEAEAKAI
jgi:membrane protein implicated in regulation of membrane protease activity